MQVQEAAATLKANLAALGSGDQAFAASLLTQFAGGRKPLSEKQAFWMVKLAGRAAAPKPAAPAAVTVGDLGGIKALFEKAAQHLKAPSVVLNFAGGMIRLRPAQPGSKYPKAIHVAEAKGDFETRTYFGRIEDGQFQPGFKAAERHDMGALAGLLRDFAEDPAGVAGEHGRLNGSCCFCNRPLEDERSTAVGYGPVCADRFELPWGDAASAF